MSNDIVKKYGYLSLGTRLRRIGERLQGDVQELIDHHGISVQAHHYPLLYALDDDGPLEIGQLARTLGVSQPGVTRSVAQLTKLGYVAVFSSDTDKRVRKVDLTEQGRDIMTIGRREIAPRVTSALENIFRDQTADLLPLLDHLESALAKSSLKDNANEQ